MVEERIPSPSSGVVRMSPPPTTVPIHGGPPRRMVQQIPVQHMPPPSDNLPVQSGGSPSNQMKLSTPDTQAIPAPVPSLRGFEFRKYNKSELQRGISVSWALAQKSELPIDQTEMDNAIRSQRMKSKKTAYDEYKELKSEKMQEHAKLLINDLNAKELDKSIEWKFALFECDQRRLSQNATDISHMRIFVRRYPKTEMAELTKGVQLHAANASGQPVNLSQLPPNQNDFANKGRHNIRPSNAPGPVSLPQGQFAPHLPPQQSPPSKLPPQGPPQFRPPGTHNGLHPAPPAIMSANVPPGPLPIDSKQEKVQTKLSKEDHKSDKETKGRHPRRMSMRDSSSSDSEAERWSRSSSKSDRSCSTVDTDDWSEIRYDLENMSERIDRLAQRDTKDKNRRYSNASRFPPVPIGYFRQNDQRLLPGPDMQTAKNQPIIQNFHPESRQKSKYSDRNDRRNSESVVSWADSTSEFCRRRSDGDVPPGRDRRPSTGVVDAYREHRRPSASSSHVSRRPLAEHVDYPPGKYHSQGSSRDSRYKCLERPPAYEPSEFARSGGSARRPPTVRRRTIDAVEYTRDRNRRTDREGHRREHKRSHSYR